MFRENWRESTWSCLDQRWDVVVIGAGITGAGVFRRCVSAGLKTLMVDAGDFASGTSSKSSKLVHGGIRYLRNRQYNITFESVKERERLLKQARELVNPLGFIMPYSNKKGMKETFRLGVNLYDLMALKRSYQHFNPHQVAEIMPQLSPDWLVGAFLYFDANVDDARMVLRLLQETLTDGGAALNYTRALSLLHSNDGKVQGVLLEDLSGMKLGTSEVRARVVVNAAGPWSDEMRALVNAPPRIRPLRGSHLVFPFQVLPIKHAVSLVHPRDGRAMFAIPWESTTILGTTDLDHSFPLKQEPYCSQSEIDYILDAAHQYFPQLDLRQEKLLSTYAGLRPIVRGDANNPSSESRAHAIMEEEGLITITGGKLTIFRIMAEDTFKRIAIRLNLQAKPLRAYFHTLPKVIPDGILTPSQLAYISGRYGSETLDVIKSAQTGELAPVDNLPTLWAEARYNARFGGVVHLDDLLLRRLHLGSQLPDGAENQMKRIRKIAQTELEWSDMRWEQEYQRYRNIYQRAFSNAPLGFDQQ